MEIPCKTAAGQAELAYRQRGLSQRHRTLLFIVDGKRSLEEVIELGAQAGVPKAYIDELLALGLVVMAAPLQTLALEGVSALGLEPTAPDRFEGRAAQAGVSTNDLTDAPPPATDSDFQTTQSGDTRMLGLALSNTELSALDGVDADHAEARRLLMELLRSHAPVSGAMTLLRARRARDRTALLALLPEAQARLGRAAQAPAVAQALARVASLLTL